MALTLYGKDPLKMFEDVFNERLTPFISSMGSMMAPAFKVDISEDEKAIYLSADIPGVKKEDVKVSIEDDVISISAERTQEEEEKKKNYHRVERSWGSLSRSFTIGDNVDSDNITANYDNGVLKVVIPKKEPEQKKSKEIAVS
ncbi:MAG TPA: Hsp20/alpha crystallin family protein [Chlorobaculum sp.]|jgi:HSP20 family protein|uniref:Heat shock protein, Hsp20 family n=1 Tax=Chlorobaculum tepidum (strain ATCC 49652 / DSM 12025 / NBRC 103806 / TLS) TaxID=194439 RepID=Q8KB28_CHLTE|nr:Hsp20/alpha crystallin family protein [Chlorobaculum tepidum]AAM73188.1 heat shock protein, Hsp20 family [Chlorobaculum tepidum TLS]HBU23302.1 Hsp20/alpha crystallin family protein [Chlorobaculum sp.]